MEGFVAAEVEMTENFAISALDNLKGILQGRNTNPR